MSTLPAGASITSIGGKRCTAIPRTATTVSGDDGNAATATSAVTSSSSSSSTSTSTSTSTSSSSSTTSTTTSSSSILTSTSTTAAGVVSQSLPAIVAPAPAVVTSQVTSIASTSLSTNPSSTLALSSSFTDVLQSTTASRDTSSTISTLSVSNTENPQITGSTTVLVSSSTVVIAESAVTGAAISVTSTNSKTTSRTKDGLGTSTQSLNTGTSSSLLSTSTSSTNSAEVSAASSISSAKVSVAPIVGGVVGGFAFVGLIGLLFWFLKRRQRKRDSFLTPLTTARQSQFYEIDTGSVGPTRSVTKWKANAGGFLGRIRGGVGEIGVTLKRSVSGGINGKGGSNVNLNRGNSQFLEQVPQHSRSNSAVSGHVSQVTAKDRLGDWLERFKEGIVYKLRPHKEKDMVDPFAAAREKQMTKARGQPDFSTLLAMEERELQRAAEQRRMSLSGGLSPESFGSLGLNFNSSLDPNNEKNPFADPLERRNSTIINPFDDPIRQPKPLVPKVVSSNYVDTIRRSRGQSVSLSSNPITQVPQSRYPSTIVASTIGGNRDTYRDTYMTSSTSGRKTKGRSDPFDLEAPTFSGPIPAMPTPNLASNTASSYFAPENSNQTRNSGLPANPRSSLTNHPNSIQGIQMSQTILDTNSAQPRIISSVGTYSSKYSSGTSMGGWGDPGPDLGPGSSSRVGGNTGFESVTTSTVGLIPVALFEGRGVDGRAGSVEEWDERRRIDDASVGSGQSAGRGIGKAR